MQLHLGINAAFTLLSFAASVTTAALSYETAVDTGGLPIKCPFPYHTFAYKDALKKAPYSVRKVAELVQEADTNPSERFRLDWNGEQALTCDLGPLVSVTSWMQQAFPRYVELMGMINMTYMYSEHENIACVRGHFPWWFPTCMYLEGVKRPLSGMYSLSHRTPGSPRLVRHHVHFNGY